jgi:hypothetical protein
MIQGVNKHTEIAAQAKNAHANDSADELLQSANSASGSARNAWLAYLVLNVYLLVTIAGVTHVDLLLNSTVTLPIVNVKIPLFSFFWAAPVLLLLVHLGFLVQHAMLARKYQHFKKAVSAWENSNNGVHPSRRYVDGYVFSQMTAGPKPPKLLGFLMRLMVFTTFSLLPVLVLLYFQIKFLPYHEVGVTHVHRLTIFLDLVLLFTVRPYFPISYLRPEGSKLKIGSKDWPWELSYRSVTVSAVAFLTISLFSLFVATVPQGCVNPFKKQTENCPSLDKMVAKWAPQNVGSSESQREVFALTALLFENKIDPDTGEIIGIALFDRSIVVTGTDLVPDKDDKFGEVSISLRGRDLRFAVLDRSDLHLADLAEVNLRESSLFNANLERANLTSANLQGAELREANLQGADLRWAELQGAELRVAELQGADLREAELQGADLRGANLQGADLRKAKLYGANLGVAHTRHTRSPGENTFELADLTNAQITPLTDEDRKKLQMHIDEWKDSPWGTKLKTSLKPLLASDSRNWGSSEESRAWKLLITKKPNSDNISYFLADLVCLDETDGYIAKPIIRRALRGGYNGSLGKFSRIVSDKKCVGAKTLDDHTKTKLCESASWSEDDIKQTFCSQ